MGAYDDILSGTTEYSLTDSYDSWIDASMTGAVNSIGAVGSIAGFSGTNYSPTTGNINLSGIGIGNITAPNLNTGNIMWANVSSGSTHFDSQLVITHKGEKINVGEAITMLMDRLCIIEPSLHLHEKYPALKEAYDAYKAIEAMCKAGDIDE